MPQNFFDRFDDGADLTKPLGGMDRQHTPAELTRMAAPAAQQSDNFFDRFDSSPAPAPTSTPTPKASGRSWGQWLDQEAQQLGLMSPAEYDRRHPQTPDQAAAAPVLHAPAPRNWFDRFGDSAEAAVEHYSPAALAARAIAGAVPSSDTWSGAPGADNSQAGQAARAGAGLADGEREWRRQEALRDNADPVFRDGESWLSPGALSRGSASLLGSIAGGAISDPTALVAPGEGIIAKMIGQAAVGGAVDAGTQGGEIAQGVRDNYDPLQTAVAAGGGAAFVGGIEGLGALRRWWKSRGINVDNVPDEALVSGSLDGTIGDTSLTADQVDAILRSAGQDNGMAAFTTPEAAAAAAQRAQAAQERVPVNGRFTPNEIPDVVPPRTVPSDVSIQAGPEGGVRSDDAGSIASVERKRAADATVLTEAQRRVADDPLVSSILDSNLSPQAKVATVWDRIARQNAANDMPDLPDVPEVSNTPWAASTPDDAARQAERQANPRRSRIHDITQTAESSGQRYGRDGQLLQSSAGARGEMQVMPGTSRDPGYGVRPAQNDSADELARVGRDYIDALQRHYGGDMSKAWAAYNAGPGAVDGAVAKHGAGWLDHMPAETRAYVNRNVSALGGREPPAPFRAGDYSSTGPGYSFDAFDAGQPLRRNTTENRGQSEVPESFAERQAREATGGEMGTGNSTRPFRAGPEDAGWEARADASAQDQFRAAQDRLEREWEARRQADAEREAQRGADQRFQDERVRGEEAARGDPEAIYRGKYAQKPHSVDGLWRTTKEGFVAGADGNPVAFRSAREAAGWAAKNQMGGDFELATWATNSKRVVLKRRENSTYGQQAPRPEGPQEPAAGRSPDTSQRLIGERGGEPGAEPRVVQPERTAATIGDARRIGGELVGQPIRNEATGVEATISRNNLAKMTSQSALKKSSSVSDHLLAVSNADHLFRSAHLISRMPDPRGEPTLHISRWRALLETPEGQRSVKLTVKETAHPDNPNGLYTIETAEVEPGPLAPQRGIERAPGQDRFARGAGSEGNIAREAPPVERQPIPAETRAPVTGGSEQVVTPRGRSIDTQFQVREARDLIDSAHASYDQRFQPRERGARASSDAQIAEMAARLDPEQLHSSRLASHGAPIVGPDRLVESGNGRTAAIRRAYQQHPEQAAAYRAMLERRGFDTSGFDEPVLVRQRTTDLTDEERAAFAREGQDNGTMDMSSTEKAKADAKTLSHDTLGLYRGGDVLSAENREFVRAWMREVPSPSERNALVLPDGSLSSEGIRRLRASMLAKAFDSPELIARVVENPDNNIRAIGNALTDVSPALAELRARIDRGELGAEYDITPQLAEVANLISQARESGKSIADMLKQSDMFAGDVDPVTEALANLMFKGGKQPRSGQAIADALRFYVDETAKIDSGPSLFGGEPPVTPLAILRTAHRNLFRDEVSNGESGFIDVGDVGKALKGLFNGVASALVDGEDLGHDLAAFKRRLGEPRAALSALTRPMRDAGSALLFTNDGMMRSLAARFSSPAIGELADKFHARAGKGDGTSRTYHEAVQQAAVTRIGKAHEALEPFMRNQASLLRIRELLTHPNRNLRASAEERQAATTLRDLLKDTIAYRKAAGEDIGEVSEGYFPRVLDEAKVAKNREDFLQRAEKLYRNVGADDPKGAAEAWFARVFDTYSGLDGALDHRGRGSGGIAGNTAKPREFGREADDLLRDFYHDDVFQTLASYFTGSARRAEETRRFGAKGAVDSPEREAWVAEHGDKTQADVLWDKVKSEVRESGIDAGDVLHRLQKAYNANLGRVGSVSHTTRTMISYAHAWNQISKMDRTLVTSLGELTMGFIRGGPRYGVSFVKDSAVEFARQLRKAAPSDAQRWAEAISVAQDAMVNQALTSRISAEGSTRGVQKVLAGYYRGILLHQFTEAERIAATRMGRKLIGDLAHDMESSNARVRARSGRYLKELGISDPEAFSAQLRKGEPDLEQVRRDAPGLASDYTTALIRFVNQTVMAPSRAEKPAWSAHPVGSLFSSLLGYSFAFKKNVLDRVGRMGVDAIKEKDAHLLLPAAMLPIMAAFQYLNDTYLRPALFGSSYDFSSESPGEAALRIADRAGFTGPLSPVVNAFKSIKYNRNLTESLAGPVVGSALNDVERIATPFVGRNSPNTNTAERNAAAAFYDAVVEPAIDALGAKYLRGALRTGVIVGTGNRRGGALPGDKDAFVDELGGPAPERNGGED